MKGLQFVLQRLDELNRMQAQAVCHELRIEEEAIVTINVGLFV